MKTRLVVEFVSVQKILVIFLFSVNPEVLLS